MKARIQWIVPILLAGVLILSACQPAPQAEDVPPVQSESNGSPGIPEIDLAQPDDFATATFSMG